jgi:cell division protease FtsH
VLDNLVLALMEKETLSKEEVLEIFAPVEKRPSRGSWTGTGKRRPSSRPPVTTPAELALANGGSKGSTVSGSNGSGASGNGSAPDLQKQPAGSSGSATPAEPGQSGAWPPPPPPAGGQEQRPSGPVTDPWAPPGRGQGGWSNSSGPDRND